MSNDAINALDNTIAFIDQGVLLTMQANRCEHAIQCTWVYSQAINLDELRKLADNLAHGLLGRRIECSPLPFGRHRWISATDAPAMDIAPAVESRDQLAAWVDARAEVPTSAVDGPTWHLGVLPMGDNGTAVSLVASHSAIDALGLCQALADGIRGITRDLGYPQPSGRTKRRALLEDTRQSGRDLPELARALRSSAKAGMTALRGSPVAASDNRAAPKAKPTPRTIPDLPAVVATATIFVDLAEWDARANALGGTSNSLFAGFAGKFAEKVGRINATNGLVSVTYPMTERTDGDTRANALRAVDFTINPQGVTEDLRPLRESMKAAFTEGVGTFEELKNLLLVVPFIPQIVVRNAPVDGAWFENLPVGCSNLGDIDPAVADADGTAAEHLSIRLVKQNLTARNPDLRCGELYMMSGRICGKLFITFRFYRAGTTVSKRELREHISSTLAEFELSGTFE